MTRHSGELLTGHGDRGGPACSPNQMQPQTPQPRPSVHIHMLSPSPPTHTAPRARRRVVFTTKQSSVTSRGAPAGSSPFSQTRGCPAHHSSRPGFSGLTPLLPTLPFFLRLLPSLPHLACPSHLRMPSHCQCCGSGGYLEPATPGGDMDVVTRGPSSPTGPCEL